MSEIAFNLLDEPWIRLMGEDCAVRECTLPQALLESHRYRRLAGELPTQNVAILRLLLAVLHTVFYRVDLDGEEDPIEEPTQALQRWQRLWKAGCFPEAPIRNYLNEWKERFWLFHPEHPFFQVPSAAAGTQYTAAKLNGELSESSNKVRLFPVRAGQDKDGLSYAEAARWLVNLNGFDDTSAKPKGKGLPSPGAGWLGKLGLVYVEGKTLFETLMLNLTLLKDGRQLWEEPAPVWELDKPIEAERTEIAMPNNQAELLTLQSRRLLLIRENAQVVGYALLGGDFFSKINADAEQMTLWEYREGKKNVPPYNQPKRLKPDRQMWRDFSVITAAEGKGKIPGVMSWVLLLKSKRILDSKFVAHFRAAGAKYGDKDFFVEDVLEDHLDFHVSLLEEAGKLWDKLVQDEIAQTEKAAWHLGMLAEDLFKAAGGQPDSNAQTSRKDLASQTYYGQVDIPFRKWLASIDPDLGDGETHRAEKDARWRREAYRIALEQGRKMVQNAGQAAFTGRGIDGTFYSSPDAFNYFSWQLKKLFKIENSMKEEADEKP